MRRELSTLFVFFFCVLSCKNNPNNNTCGDGVVDAGEACDDGNQVNGDGCENDCTLTVIPETCGDFNVDAGEGCDDGNTTPGDGCNQFCQDEVCGDGIDNNGNAEQCDDGNQTAGDGCENDCTFTPAAPSACDYQDLPGAPVLFVAIDGDDQNGDGSEGNPFATITEAVNNAADGSLIIVKPGVYNGGVRLDRSFAQGITVRSEVPYQAKLRDTGTVVRVFTGQGITMEGFDIAHAGPGASALVIQIQDLIDDPGGADFVSRITLRNNILHDSFNNDILKINNGAGQITVERNIFYNQTGSDEHIDVNSVTDVVIQDNIFFNDFAGSGRANNNDTSSYIVVKDSNGTDDSNLGSSNITIRRNIFAHYEGSAGSNMVLLGEDGNPFFEVQGALIENNLFIGDASNDIRAPFGCKGVSDVTFRFNTIVGDFPGDAFAFRLNQEGANLPNDNIQIFGNVFADLGGTMDKFSTTPAGQTSSFVLNQNVYFNGGQSIPINGNELINRDDDANGIEGDPVLGSQAGLVVPRLVDATGLLADGSVNQCQAFENLVALYGTPGANSVVVGAADQVAAPAQDILGKARPGVASIGACEP